ncbi:N-6 DNA methylase [Candidatus Parcubacteria bacterium]|nr:N-6 DNA methylase [Candidatus Parcubacteria bacterium]
MANERITENFFRKFVLQDEFYKNNKIIFEEQSSKNIKIDKLLKNTSKGGVGKGYPEFVIQFKENPDFIIVVECKADSRFHESKNKNKYKDYAVDGALLYSSFLSKEFDVLSIAISGERKNNLKISHFLQLNGTEQCHKIFKDNSFLPLENYLNGYQTDERKFNQDFQELLKYSKTLNDSLHILKVPESNRSLLISGALIALHDKAFRNAYKYQKPKELAENLINTIKNKLADVQNKHIDDIITSYSFIKTHTILSKQENKLRDIIESVDKRINNFIKTYKYFDTLGQFYIEFLRYANNDKGLGIVLTPPHITELFCEIANVNKDSVVLDTCTGTGGFLISAMKKMVIDAGGNKKKELEIKSKQIIGIELQHSIFSLTCSNMYIHGDGRSNLIKGSCFDEKIIKQVKKYKPNVGFLNPPYKSNKNDVEELEFILNNLSMLEKGSSCVAIVPTSCMLADTGKKLELKEKVLKRHTLEAVFSMPNELFYNSNVSVATCIVVFKAKEKHPNNYKTYFGIWNNDGFVKIKNIGRTDFYNKWELIKKDWIENYRNKDEMIGHSIKQIVNKNDEWVAESYIKIDYLKTTKIDFKNFLFKYVGSLFLLKKLNCINKTSKNKNNLDIKNKRFKYFNLTGKNGLFYIQKGERLNKNLRVQGKIPLLTSTSLNNGISNFIDYNNFKNSKKIFENKITIDMLSNVFYHGYRYFSDDNIHTLILKEKYQKFDNQYTLIFIATLLQNIDIRYNYGRQARLKRLENETIALPTNDKSNIDWKFMEDYIKSLPYSSNL